MNKDNLEIKVYSSEWTIYTLIIEIHFIKIELDFLDCLELASEIISELNIKSSLLCQDCRLDYLLFIKNKCNRVISNLNDILNNIKEAEG